MEIGLKSFKLSSIAMPSARFEPYDLGFRGVHITSIPLQSFIYSIYVAENLQPSHVSISTLRKRMFETFENKTSLYLGTIKRNTALYLTTAATIFLLGGSMNSKSM